MTSSSDPFNSVPALFYTHNEQRGETLHRSEPASIHRDLRALGVEVGARILEIGTGSGYSGALLAELVGPQGQVVSVDVDEHLVGWANRLHPQRGLTNIRCHRADGMAGYPAEAPYDRIVAWCAPPRLPQAWVDQVIDGGRIVACLPIAPLPSTTLVATVTVEAGRPRVEAVTGGGYAQSTPTAVDDALTVPGRWVDWCDQQPEPSWIAIGWRADDDGQHTGARSALHHLLNPRHTEPYDRQPLDWRSWHTYAATLADPHVSLVALRNQIRGLGHTTATSAAVILTDATVIADSPHSPSLHILRDWLARWEQAARPAADVFTTALLPHYGSDLPGWGLKASYQPREQTQPAGAAPSR
ncbi:hypothetical protein GCM10020358_68510 [Amorphoplanes nipponensis]|uniref:Protein-L-isoaspartate O-methyltransferase n=1 Tax=Actinoplanes nipponensis TaxID=135950 RepID=A0A919JIT5_9ACTN|nr:methyltransferase domain-containing protein [Actinoplanes nipponensis]GIE51523.1 hypothetical protein Ani05nite_50570 [Actinoplanes nipponensis]